MPDEYHVMGSDPVADFRHRARYEAFDLVYKGDVLDVGCGSGYGMEIINASPQVDSVDGVDKQDVLTVELVSELDFIKCDFLAWLPPTMQTYDTIVMVEVIEHLPRVDQFRAIEKVLQILKPGGIFCCTTPRAVISGESETNPHHLYEMTREDFFHLLEWGFRNIALWEYPEQVLTDGVAKPMMCATARRV